MKGQINSGCCIPFFTDRRYQSRYDNDLGHEIVGASRYLVPFMVWQNSGPALVSSFQLVDVVGGAIQDLDTSLIQISSLTDLTKTWYYYTGEDIFPEIVACGSYEIVIKLDNDTTFYSDIIKINVIGEVETQVLTADVWDVAAVTMKAVHTVNTVLQKHKAVYSVNGTGPWIVTETTRVGDEVTFDLPIPIPDFGSWYKVKYMTTSNFNYYFLHTFTLKFDSGDPEGTYQLETIDQRAEVGKELFAITVAHSGDYNGILYSKPDVKQVMYLEGSFDYPAPFREAEFEQNGNGVSHMIFNQLRHKSQLVLIKIPDQFLQLLSDLSSHDTVSILDLTTGKEYTNLVEIEFSPEEAADKYFSRGVLRFQSDYAQRGACVENLETT